MATMKSTYVPYAQREFCEYLQEKYGGMMSIDQIAREIGVKDRRTVLSWLNDCKRNYIGRSIRFRSSEIARKIYEDMEEARG